MTQPAGKSVQRPRTLADDLKRQAEFLHSLGLSLIPIKAGTKQPLGSWRDAQTAPRTLARLQEQLSGNDAGGIAVVLGSVSGNLHCRDFDKVASYERWKAAYPDFATVLATVQTARGYHVYFRLPTALTIQKFDDGELRGNGHYTLLPPSMHPDGGQYRSVLRFSSTSPIPIIDATACGLDRSWSDDLLTEKNAPRLTRLPADPEDPIDPIDPKDPINPVPMTPDEVIEVCRVTQRGMHDEMTMKLARGLKHNAGLESVSQARPHFDRWWLESSHKCENTDPDAAWFKFERAFATTTVPLQSRGVAATVLAELDQVPEVSADSSFGSKLRRLIDALAEMTRRTGGKPFAISARMIAAAFNVSDQCAHEWIKGLIRRGLVECTDPGKPGAGGTGKARRLVFIGQQQRAGGGPVSSTNHE